MHYFSEYLGFAHTVGTSDGNTALISYYQSTANRTLIRHDKFPFTAVALICINPNNLRNYFTRFLHYHRIIYHNSHITNKILVMQCGLWDSSSRKTHRLKNRIWSKNPGATDIYNNIRKLCCLLLRRILICSGPSGKLNCLSKPFPQIQIVNLHNCAVDIKA